MSDTLVKSRSKRDDVCRKVLAAWIVVLPIAGGWIGGAAAQGENPQAKSKQPVPSPAVQAEVAKKLGEIFDFDAAKKPEQQVALAKELFGLSRESGNNPSEQFVLLRKAMELACDGGDAGLMIRAINAVGDRFDTNAMDVKVTMLQKFARDARTPEKIASLMECSDGVFEQAMNAHRYDAARELTEALYAAAQRPAGSKYRKRLAEGRTELRKLHQQYQEYKKAAAAIEANPADKDAILALGRWRCFVENDWEQGLFHLVEGNDAELKEAAQRELSAASGSAVDIAKAGDAWWDLAQKKKDREKTALMQHAGSCYEKARAQGIGGLSKVKIEKRLKDLEETMAAARKGKPGGSPPGRPSLGFASAAGDKKTEPHRPAAGKIEAGRPTYRHKPHEAWRDKGRVVGHLRNAPVCEIDALDSSGRVVKSVRVPSGATVYELEWLRPGVYTIRVSAKGYQPLIRKGVEVKARHDLFMDLAFSTAGQPPGSHHPAIAKIKVTKPTYRPKDHEAWRTRGRIVGRLRNSPVCEIDVLNSSGKIVKSTRVHAGAGAYELEWLAPGAYTLRISVKGCRPLALQGLQVKARHDLFVDLEFIPKGE